MNSKTRSAHYILVLLSLLVLILSSCSADCPLPPPFSPNRFYDDDTCSLDATAREILHIESAAFRQLTAQSDQIRRPDTHWCFLDDVPGGRPYLYDNFAIHGVALLDLIQQLQLLPPRCISMHQPLRDLLLSKMSTPLSNVTIELVTSYHRPPPGPPELTWWENEFLPTTARAFSCGFTPEDQTEPPSQLPPDIRQAFASNDLTVQRVWRLVKGYFRSPQKQREPFHRQADFDVSLYVPFLKLPRTRTYMGLEGNLGCQMRGGFPAYQGPSIWYLHHTIAARTAALERQCHDSITSGNLKKILSTYKILMSYLGLTHPCPHCREHLLSRASRNDQNWKAFGLEAMFDYSESKLYPLEYLFLSQEGSFQSKLDTIVDGDSLMLFAWKIHNAITSATYYNIQCRTVEMFDEEEAFRCVDQGPDYTEEGYQFIASTRTLGRAWPTAKRYEFWLGSNDIWETIRSNPAIREAYQRLKELDKGDQLREAFWTNPNKDGINTTSVHEATAALDAALLATNVLSTEYTLSATPLDCGQVANSLNQWQPLSLDVPLPLLEDGNFPPPPPACKEHLDQLASETQQRRRLESSKAQREADCGLAR